MKKNIIISGLTLFFFISALALFFFVSSVRAKDSNFEVKDFIGTWEGYETSVFNKPKKLENDLVINMHSVIKDGVRYDAYVYIIKDFANRESLSIKFLSEDREVEKEEIYFIENIDGENILRHYYVPNYIETSYVYRRKND